MILHVLDCYLGLLAKDMILPQQQDDPASALTFSTQDFILLSTVVVVTLVGTYAAQVAEKIWKEIQIESSLGDSDRDDSTMSVWAMMGVDLSRDVPTPIRDISAACDRVNLVIKDEMNALNESMFNSQVMADANVTKQSIWQLFPNDDVTEPSYDTNPIPRLYLMNNETSQVQMAKLDSPSLLLINSKSQNLVLGTTSPSSSHFTFEDTDGGIPFGNRTIFAFEAQPTSSTVPWGYQQRYLTESAVFGVLLLSALFINST